MLYTSRIFLHFAFFCLYRLYEFLYSSFLTPSCNLKKTVLLLLFQTSNALYTFRKQKLLCFPVWLVQVLCLSWCLGKECSQSQHCISQTKMQCLLQFMACCCQPLAKDCAQALKLFKNDGVLEHNTHCRKFAAHVVITQAHFSI